MWEPQIIRLISWFDVCMMTHNIFGLKFQFLMDVSIIIDHATPLCPQKLALDFVSKWRSLSRYSSLLDQGPWSLFVCLFVCDGMYLINGLPEVSEEQTISTYRVESFYLMKCCYLGTKLHYVVSQKTIILNNDEMICMAIWFTSSMPFIGIYFVVAFFVFKKDWWNLICPNLSVQFWKNPIFCKTVIIDETSGLPVIRSKKNTEVSSVNTQSLWNQDKCECHHEGHSNANLLSVYKIWGSHNGDYEECHLLGCYAVWLM
jgi:hypothetical protein